MPDIARIQGELKAAGADGWLLYDFHNRDPIAYHVLGLDFGKFTSRRWFYFIPAAGDPVRLVHKVEPRKLDGLPGEKPLYLAWSELHERLRAHARSRAERSPCSIRRRTTSPTSPSWTRDDRPHPRRSATKWFPRPTWCRRSRRSSDEAATSRTWKPASASSESRTRRSPSSAPSWAPGGR